MRWRVNSKRTLYQDQWVHLRTADVELPDGRHLDHRLIETGPGVGAVVVVDHKVLLLWRHRFITDTWGWEIPLGGIEPGESAEAAARREVEEETGWRPTGALTPLTYTQPSPGLITSEHHIFRAEQAELIGEPRDYFESERIEWIPLTDVRRLIDTGDITAATTLTVLLYLA
ncbi:NUDIX hydrolase [Natronoglycomyces albus]|uniref:NUDIX hydrolase n=1 Tax=Natronoglycomyces albus TaxID=2811108 RepID=A0A895XGF6_9ACTN|nr:NUDIX hydrolase [Natronoglycomyces albus]QSB04424.1 NUDIX hydrolase [Natronoglycomyces albus]